VFSFQVVRDSELIRKPKLLILDEPTNHLDQNHVKQIMNNIDNLNYNPAILLISHDESVVKQANEIFTFENKKLIQVNQA